MVHVHDAVVRNGIEARNVARTMRHHRYQGDEMSEQFLEQIVAVAGPFFNAAVLSTPLVVTSRRDKHILTIRLFDYIEHKSVGLCRARMADVLPFLWSYIAVDVDMNMWNERFPFSELFMAIMSSIPRHELNRLHLSDHGENTYVYLDQAERERFFTIPDMMRRFVRVYALRCAADDIVHNNNNQRDRVNCIMITSQKH